MIRFLELAFSLGMMVGGLATFALSVLEIHQEFSRSYDED